MAIWVCAACMGSHNAADGAMPDVLLALQALSNAP